MKKRKVTKITFAVSICLLVLWSLLGVQTTIAWYRDETPIEKNSFDVQELDLVVYHKVGALWEVVTEDTEIFDEEALYEPGHTQVVYLKIENKGTVDFDYRLSVDLISFLSGQSELGNYIYLPNYLKFGTVIEKTEPALDRELARAKAPNDMVDMFPLNTYASEIGKLDANQGDASVEYAAIIIHMPESVGNEANYRGDIVPEVKLGITVNASQRGTLTD